MKLDRTIRLLLITILLLLTTTTVLHAGSVRLNWQPNIEADLQSYNVYFGNQPRTYAPPVPVGNVNEYELIDLQEGQIYYFAVSAVDNAGNESGFSPEVAKQITVTEDLLPIILITTPVEGNTYTTGSPTIAIAGSASDDNALQKITWTNSTGSSGIANGTTNWSIEAIDLVEGENLVTVTATDSTGNTAQDAITVTYTAANGNNGLPVVSVASSSDDGNVAANTIDNNLSTRWSANGEGQWIQYDLGTVYSITELRIAFYRGDARTTEFEISVSNDANSWNHILRETSSGATLQQEIYNIPSITGRYVRITGYGNSANSWNSITEVDIRGTVYSVPDITDPSVEITFPSSSGTFETSDAQIQMAGTASDNKNVTEDKLGKFHRRQRDCFRNDQLDHCRYGPSGRQQHDHRHR